MAISAAKLPAVKIVFDTNVLFTQHELKLIGQNSHLQLEQVNEQNRWIQQEWQRF